MGDNKCSTIGLVEKSVACSFLEELKRNTQFTRKFIEECLPKKCRMIEHDIKSYSTELLFLGIAYIPIAEDYATRDGIKEAVDKGRKLLSEFFILENIGPASIMNVQKASEIVRGELGEKELTEERVDELMDIVESLFYGGTPLMKTIDAAKGLFARPKYKDYKLMFIISDGQPADGNNPPIKELSDLGVTTVCCYITNDPIDDPKRLYTTECAHWDKGAKLMFKMSSFITTQTIPRTIFLKRGWNIDITKNETRLFVQVNHPDIIEDVCNLARDVVCCQDALSDILSSISLDLYINEANLGFVPKRQSGGTCYANASAAVLHLALKRIVGREGGYPDFFDLREKIIKKYGKGGANTLKVLEEVCPQYRLHCREVDILGAMKAITAKRPVIAKFCLADPAEWNIFGNFYEKNPKGILTSSTLDIKLRPQGAELGGHAVVLTSYNSECLRLMNSWGSDWADGGFFKISSADVLGLKFIDVFWTIRDLKQSEIDAYDRHGSTIANKMLSRLKGLQTAQYKCPLCDRVSNVSAFSGHHLKAKCPNCLGEFNIKRAEDNLALNMYLLSLSTQAK